jgi:hypothetical protein
MTHIAYGHFLTFGGLCFTIWFFAIYFWPRFFLLMFKRAILVQGGGDGPIPLNTLYTEPPELFADPLNPPAGASKLWTTGVNHDTLVTVGWLDLGNGPQILHVPDMAGRYYSVQLNDPSKNANFAYVGNRTTGTGVGEYLITGPRWSGTVPKGMSRICSPNNSVLVIGRTLVKDDGDLLAAYALAKQIRCSCYPAHTCVTS